MAHQVGSDASTPQIPGESLLPSTPEREQFDPKPWQRIQDTIKKLFIGLPETMPDNPSYMIVGSKTLGGVSKPVFIIVPDGTGAEEMKTMKFYYMIDETIKKKVIARNAFTEVRPRYWTEAMSNDNPLKGIKEFTYLVTLAMTAINSEHQGLKIQEQQRRTAL